jgi:hypothetical protein
MASSDYEAWYTSASSDKTLFRGAKHVNANSAIGLQARLSIVRMHSGD